MAFKHKSEAALWGKVGGFALHAKVDSRKHTEPARQAFRTKFEREVDPDNKLPAAERARRAAAARSAHYSRLAAKRIIKQREEKERRESRSRSRSRGGRTDVNVGPTGE